MSDAVRVVDGQLAVYNARDLEGFLATYADDVVLHDLAGGTIISTGKEAMRERYGKYFAANPGLRCEIANRIVAGNFVIDREQITGLAGGAEKFAVAVYEVADGLIKRVWFIRA